MSGMMDHVARVIGCNLYGYVDPNDTPMTWGMSVETARVAMEAMRGPIQEMLLDLAECKDFAHEDMIVNAWQNMLNKALK